MEIEVRIDKQLNIRFQIIKGVADLDKIISYLDKMNLDDKQNFDMNVCWNLEDADLTRVEISDIQKLVLKVSNDWLRNDTKKLAIIVSNKFRFGMTRIYQTLLGVENVSSVKIFYDVDDAIEWLTKS